MRLGSTYLLFRALQTLRTRLAESKLEWVLHTPHATYTPIEEGPTATQESVFIRRLYCDIFTPVIIVLRFTQASVLGQILYLSQKLPPKENLDG